MKREGYVILFTNKYNIDKIHCHVCGHSNVRSDECPMGSVARCSYPASSSPMTFNNKIHRVIATLDTCLARSFGCKRHCKRCALPNTITTVVIK